MKNLSLKDSESSSPISDVNPAFTSHAGVQALAIRLMMQNHGRIENGYVEITQAEINELGYTPGDVKRSFYFDGAGQGREILVVRGDMGSLLWTDAIMTVERALSMGLLPNQVYAYYGDNDEFRITLSYKVLVAWASIKRPFNVYHFEMTPDERPMSDNLADKKIYAYLVDKDAVINMGLLIAEYVDRGKSDLEARRLAAEAFRFGRGLGIVREWEVKRIEEKGLDIEKQCEKRATVAAITGSLGEPTFFEIENLQDKRTLQSAAAISAGEVVNVPPHIPAGEAETKYINQELRVGTITPQDIDGITLMRGPVEEGID